MGVIPQFIPEDRASGAHKIQGSLTTQGTINGSPFYMARTPGSAGNRRTFTWSCWFKRTDAMSSDERFFASEADSSNQGGIKFINNTEIQFYELQSGSFTFNFYSLAQYLDQSGWYNLVVAFDTTQATTVDRVHIYINGEEIAYDPAYDDYPTQNLETRFNNTVEHTLFARTGGSQIEAGQISQICWIDGQQLDASYFGFTDGLTGAWRPKKFDISSTPGGSWGTCGFYLPMDGSAQIMKDQSGQGNDWETVNGGRGGSISMDKATGALPIRNTVGGGNILAPRVLGNAGIAVTVYDDGGGNKYYLDGAKTGSLDFVRGQTVTFDTGDSTVSGHPFRFSGVSNGAHAADYRSVLFDGTGDYLLSASSTDYAFGTGDFTFEFWVYIESYPSGDLYAIASFTDDKNNIDIDGDGHLNYYDGTSYDTESKVPLNKWTHVAYSKSGTAVRIFVNGLLVYTVTSSVDAGSSARQFYIGMRYDGSQNSLNGYLSDYRVVKGTAVYTSDFTPPITSLTSITNTKLLCCNNSSVTGTTTGTVTSSGDPTSSTSNPYDTYSFGVVTGAISPGTVGAATTITFPHNAPDSLYYYCTAHSGMGGSGTIGLGTDIHKADPYAWKCVLALPYGDNLLDQSSQVACTSTEYPVDNASYGDPALTEDQNTAFYQNSLYLDGNDAVSLGIINDGLLEFGGSDFCIEFWWWGDVTLDSSYYNPILAMPWTGNTNNYSQIWIGFAGQSSGNIQNGELYCNFRGSSNTVTLESDNSKVYDDKMWHHIAVTKQGTTGRLYLDGEKKDEDTVDASMNTNLQSATSWIGGYANHGSTSGTSINAYVKGYINDFRIYKGVAKYTEDYFLPASINPTIISDSPSGTVYDSALEKPVSGSTTVKKEGDEHISVAASSDFAFGTGDFTVEGYFYILSSGSNSNVWDLRSGSSAEQFFLKCVNNTAWELRFSGGTVCSFSAYKRVWNHIAVSRSSSTLKVFVNGALTNSVSNSSNATNTGPLLISTFFDTTGSSTDYGFTGAVSSFRVVKGTGLYTRNFVPSTKPLTNVTNTKLLFCNNDSSATSATVTPGTITVTGTQTLPSSFSPFDTSIDGVLGKGSDYCIWNDNNNSAGTISRGGLYWVSGSPGNVTGTIGMPLNSGKYYWECTLAGGSTSGVYGMGTGSVAKQTALANLAGAGIKIYGYSPNGSKYENDSATGYGPTMIVGDTLSVLFDSYTRELVFWMNGVSQGVAYTVAVPERGADYVPMLHGNDNGSGPAQVRGNWGQKPFKYKPPEGYKTLNTKNLPVNIARSDQYVGIVTYTGNSATRNITGLNFQPDLVWIKDRDAAYNYVLQDSVRGAGSTTKIASNLQNPQVGASAGDNAITWSGFISSFNKEGFTVDKSGSGAIDWANVNKSSDKYVAWCWKAGGNKNTFNVDDVGYSSWAATGISGGDITPSGASINTKAGFSIIKWIATTEATPNIPHGLGKLPKFWLIKNISGSSRDWIAYTTVVDGTLDFMHLNNEEVIGNSSADAPTTTTFGTYGNDINTNGETLISYVWTEIPGYSKFGTFEGNGDGSGTNVTWDGPFVYTGFRPALVIIKSVDSENNWNVQDDVRMSYNGKTGVVQQWDNTSSESTIGTGYSRNYFADGFKITNSNYETNKPSETFLYAAWAKNPFSNLYGGQANAR